MKKIETLVQEFKKTTRGSTDRSIIGYELDILLKVEILKKLEEIAGRR